jgi:hypothetical protein
MTARREVKKLSKWAMTRLGADVPLRFTAFHPVYNMLDQPRTPAFTLATARGFSRKAGWMKRIIAPLVAMAVTVASSVLPIYASEDARKVSVVSFGLFGDQGVFRREASGAARVVAGRFGSGLIRVQYNSKSGGNATIEGLAMSLQAAANQMDAENDILLLILTSHGSRAGLVVKAGSLTQTLTPSNLADTLARTGARYKVVVISACYSGVFVPHLASPDTLVITAADADHPSFGCQDKARWTYFGNAFFNVALRQARSLKDAFVVARALVKKQELRERFEPSNPQMSGGENVQPLLVALLERPANACARKTSSRSFWKLKIRQC